jgi:hypothetical protein
VAHLRALRIVFKDGEDIPGEETRDDTEDYLSLLVWEHKQLAAVKTENKPPFYSYPTSRARRLSSSPWTPRS